MFSKLSGSKKASDKLVIDSLLAQDASLEGNLTFVQGMQIDGRVKGDIKGQAVGSVLVVGKSAVVEGSVEADHIFIDGEVHGPVKASVQLVVRAHGKIVGDVRYGRIQMEEGCSVRGALHPLPLAEDQAQDSDQAQSMPAGALA
jgi:cytoskeletal protein CcmA (bactofilin family)